MNAEVNKLHKEFCRLTGQTLTLSYQRQWSWGELVKRGYGLEDVALVVRWIKSQMGKSGSGYSPASLQFSRLIQDADIFEDRLNLAKKARGLSNRVREVKDENPKSLPAPHGWADWLIVNYPNAPVPSSFEQLPDYVQTAARKALQTT